jgi:hypothetical protein
MSKLVFAVLLSSVAADYCVSNWFPRTCVSIADGAAPSTDDGCVNGYYETFETEDACNPDNSQPNTVNGDFCVIGWAPEPTCSQALFGACVGGYNVGFDSIEDCEANAVQPAAAGQPVFSNNETACVFNWYPRVCAFIDTGLCVPGYTVGYDSIEACESVDSSSVTGANNTGAQPVFSNNETACVFSWYPRLCVPIDSGMCVSGYTIGYDSVEACEAQGTSGAMVAPQPTFGEDDVACVFSWYPRVCAFIDTGLCVPGYTVGYESIEACEGEGAGDTNDQPMFGENDTACVFSWYPRVCVPIESGLCVSGYTVGYNSTEECEAEGGAGGEDGGVQPTFGEDDVACVFSWYPRVCAFIDTGLCIPGYTVGYDSIEACELTDDNAAGAQPVFSNNETACVFSWHPRLCVNISSGLCVTGYTVGFDSIAECEAVGTGDGDSAPVDTLSVDGDYCVSNWFPRMCDMTNSSNCVTGYYVGFDSMAACLGEDATPSAPAMNYTGMWCQTHWFPVQCGQYPDVSCVYGMSQMHESEADCLGEDGVATMDLTGYCLTSWWPKACALRSEGNCVGGSPTYSTMEECDPADVTPMVNNDDKYCLTSWWPVTCGLVGDGGCRTGSQLFDTMLECNPNWQDPMAPVASGYCVTKWWPKQCDLISSGSCAGWYPDGGYDTEALCLA